MGYYDNLQPLLIPRGTPITDAERLAQLVPGEGYMGLTDYEDRKREGYEGDVGAECHGFGAWALAKKSDSDPVVVHLHYIHTPEQLAKAEEIKKIYDNDGIALSGPIETIVGRGDNARVLAAYEGYASDADAVFDARRIALASVLERDVYTQDCGWEDECVFLSRGGEGYFAIFRTRGDGRIDCHLTDLGAMDALAKYAETVMDLAGGLPKVAQAWLYREAGEAMTSQAKFALESALWSSTMPDATGKPLSTVAGLARALHTDRGNLSRQVGKAKAKYAERIPANRKKR
ncbi:hypothetical protein [Nocardia sp. NPDC003963]